MTLNVLANILMFIISLVVVVVVVRWAYAFFLKAIHDVTRAHHSAKPSSQVEARLAALEADYQDSMKFFVDLISQLEDQVIQLGGKPLDIKEPVKQ